ncbi:hypothetical protein KDA11_05785 [Candidatus Saccharibacteria bacterium]|nr:hypothetical protein [Candidatus Saccharibacteria bacterium]
MSITNSVVENLPIAGAVSGALVGAVAEQMAIYRVNQNRQALSAVVEGLPTQKPSALRRLGAPLIWGAAGLGMLNGMVWSPEAQDEQPSLHMIVDHSGATAVIEPRSIDGINEIVEELATSNGLDSTIHVAGIGKVRTLDLGATLADRPGGSAPLGDAFSRASDAVSEKRREMIGSNKTQNTGVFVVTNGNPVGADATTTITSAQELNVPVFIANVEGETTAPETTESLKNIAEQTGGEYWAVDDSNASDILSKIEDTLKGADLMVEKPSNNLPYKIAAVAIAGMFVAEGYRRRAENTTGINIGRQ